MMTPKTQTISIATDDDDLFSRPPRTSQLRLFDEIWITCRVCGIRSKVTVDNEALLCGPCRIDPVATRVHVETTLAMVEARWQAAWEAFDAQAEGVPEWGTIEAARSTADPALFAEAWRRRKAQGGALGALLEAREALDELSDEMQRRKAWADAALEEIIVYAAPSPAPAGRGERK